jgi:hypothetical protein
MVRGENIKMNAFSEIKKGFEIYGKTIATVINSILLTLVYILGIGITSILAKITGKNFLEIEVNRTQKTYWSKLNLGKEELSSYYRQF